MQPTSATWRDLTFTTGVDAMYRILEIDGWEGRPPTRYDKQVRARGHGTHRSPVWADERLPTITGRCWSQEDRDALFDSLDRRFSLEGGEEPLTVSVAGRTLTANAQLLRFDPALVRDEWGIGRFGWAAQWRCPDPLRYGAAQAPVSTGLATTGGGLVYPLTYPLAYGTSSSPALITLTNEGTAPAPFEFQVTGGLPLGFQLSAGEQRITYPWQVPAGQTLFGDTGTGTLLAEGTADRRGYLTQADWMQVAPGSSLTIQFTSLGGPFDAAASFTVPAFRSAYW